MNKTFTSLFTAALVGIFSLLTPSIAQAVDVQSAPIALVGAQGYDLVSYHSGSPVRGSGYHAVPYKGITYIFQNEENAAMFKSKPEMYLPAFGGFCAMGVAKGKKIEVDPMVWKIVDGRLYLNVNSKVQGIWIENQSKNIMKANSNWENIMNMSPMDL
ncbi:MAG: YHS domain-containing (seleno)protein [Opitutales bacterium]